MHSLLVALFKHVVLWSGSAAHKFWVVGGALFLWLVYSAGCLFYAYRGDPWSHGDWLISYSGGFIRRGLMGEVIFYFGSLSGIPIAWIVASIQIAAAGVFFFGLAFILFLKNITLGQLTVLLNPLSVGYVLVDPATAGRKEIMILALVVVWGVLETRTATLSVSKIILGLSMVIVVLSHEGLFFFIPLFLLVSISTRPTLRMRELAQRSFLLLAPSSLALLFVVAVQASATAEQLCAPLLGAGYTPYTCDGAIYSAVLGNADGAASALSWLASFPSSYILYLLFLLGFLALSGLVMYSASSRESKFPFWTQIALVLSAVSFTTPLFLVAVDWGRFVHVVAVVITIAVISLSITDRPITVRPLKSRAHVLVLAALISSLATMGVSVSDGQPRSILGNVLNIGYFLQGGLTPEVFG